MESIGGKAQLPLNLLSDLLGQTFGGDAGPTLVDRRAISCLRRARSCTLCDADGSCQPCCPSTRNVDDDWHLSWISIPERRALCTSDDWIATHCCRRGRTDAELRKRGGRMPVSVCSPAQPLPTEQISQPQKPTARKRTIDST